MTDALIAKTPEEWGRDRDDLRKDYEAFIKSRMWDLVKVFAQNIENIASQNAMQTSGPDSERFKGQWALARQIPDMAREAYNFFDTRYEREQRAAADEIERRKALSGQRQGYSGNTPAI